MSATMNAKELLHFLYHQSAQINIDGEDLAIEAEDDMWTDALLSAIKAHKPELIALIKSLQVDSIRPQKIARAESYNYSTSPAQQRMLFMEELAGQQSYYNIPTAYKITGELNIPALRAAFFSLVKQHDIFRTTFALSGDEYRQTINKLSGFNLIERDLSAQAPTADELEHILQQEANHLFVLDAEWPLRVTLITLAQQEYILIINIHHIAADGWCARKIIADINAAYALALTLAPDTKLATQENEREYQYADYIDWQNAWEKSGGYDNSRNFWQTTLAQLPELHNIPLDFIRPNTQSVIGETHITQVAQHKVATLKSLASQFHTTPFTLLQSVFAIFLARYTGESDLVFGTAIANRNPIEFLNTMGLFANTLVLRHSLADDMSFKDAITHAIAINEGAQAHQSFPFDSLVDILNPKRSTGYNPLVQLMLVMQDDAEASLHFTNTSTQKIQLRQAVSKFDLSLHIHLNGSSPSLHWEYNSSLFKASTIATMAAHFELILDACLANPAQNIYSTALVQQDFLRTAVAPEQFPTPISCHKIFEQYAEQSPDTVAIVAGEHTISYLELDRLANKIANMLAKKCPQPNPRIGLCLEKSPELIAGLLAIFKMGGVYVPLDPYYPSERLEHMIQDSAIDILITNAAIHTSHQAFASINSLYIVDCAQADDVYFSAEKNPQTPAYIIYTSGSTGKPKGVLVSHRSLFYSLTANRELMQLGANDLMPTLGSQAFGVSLLEILLPLTSGGAVAITTKAQSADIEALIKATNQVTVLHAVPSVMKQIFDSLEANDSTQVYPHLRLLLIGGEPVPLSLLKRIQRWRSQVQLLELYGMTEVAVVCSSYDMKSALAPYYCIGKPHSTTQFYVLSAQQQCQPIGVPGELCIGGLSLASEYINHPELTAEKFFPHPFIAGDRLYKTGDKVRQLSDGHFEFLGRTDNQVSLRGVRIELGEIEAIAAAVAGVDQAIAHVLDFSEDNKSLAVYYTRARSSDETIENIYSAIKTAMAKHLPDYMRPSFIENLERFPLNPNGKIDRKKLPLPLPTLELIAPNSLMETQLVALWQEVLQQEAISVTANFFEIGGHSLMASKLMTRIRAEFAMHIPLSVIFENPSIRQLAAYLEETIAGQLLQQLAAPQLSEESALRDEVII